MAIVKWAEAVVKMSTDNCLTALKDNVQLIIEIVSHIRVCVPAGVRCCVALP